MPTGIRHFIRSVFETKATVLMYHRVAALAGDPWEICVKPENFEAQLQLLQQTGKVISLAEMADNIRKKRVKKNSIAITFDDGYADNYAIAKPLLEKYGLPATFFITTAHTGGKTEFWWDELENLILQTEKLPPFYSGNIHKTPLLFELAGEAILNPKLQERIRKWKACSESPPTIRCAMFLKIWQTLKPLPPQIQQQELQKLRHWAGLQVNTRANYTCMNESQIRELSCSPLFEIGAHTVSHIALAAHDEDFQEKELQQNRNLLRDITGKEISLLSYPYGNFNASTLSVAGKINFKAAFTTEAQLISNKTEPLKSGRFQVTDIPARLFTSHFLNHY